MTWSSFAHRKPKEKIISNAICAAVRQSNQDRFKPPLDEDELLDLIGRYVEQAQPLDGTFFANHSTTDSRQRSPYPNRTTDAP